MTTIYTGSNHGVISIANSGTGSIDTSTTITKSWDFVKHHTACSIIIKLTSAGSGGWIDFQIEYSNDNIGTVSSFETHRFLQATDTTVTAPQYPELPIIHCKPQGEYMRVVLNNNSNITVDYSIQTRYNNSADPIIADGVISAGNSFHLPSLNANVDVSGIFEDISQYSLITILTVGTAYTIPEDCILKCTFSIDGTKEDRIITYTIQDITANGNSNNSLTFNPPHTLVPIARYFKIQFTNSSTELTSLRITTTYHTKKSKAVTSSVTQSITDQVDSDITRSILTGRTIGTLFPQGHYENIAVKNQALAAYIREPTTAFGEVLTAQLTSQIQFDYSNGEPYEVQAPIYQNTGNTSYEYKNGMIYISSVSTCTQNVIQVYSSEYTKYKPGLGIDARITAVFDEDNGIGINQYIGLFTPENNLTFGFYENLGFCICHGRGGIQQVVDIAISGTSNSNNIILSFNGTSVTIPVSSGSSSADSAYAITSSINGNTGLNTYGWKALYYRATTTDTTYNVKLIRKYSSAIQISVTVTNGGGYTITPTRIRDGVDVSFQYYQQANWNIDTCITTGTLTERYIKNPSGFQLDPTKGNVYRIVFQYLGFGAITFYVENHETGNFIEVHQIKYSNTAAVPSVTSPNYRIGCGISNITGRIKLAIASAAVFVQGSVISTPLYRSYPNIIQTNTEHSILKPNSRVIFGFRIAEIKTSLNTTGSLITINRSNLFINALSAALNITEANNANPLGSANVVFQLVKNPTLFYRGNPSTTIYKPLWTAYERDSALLVFDGTAITSTTTGIGYTGGSNVMDIPLVENTSITTSLQGLLINVSSDDVYIISYYGNINMSVTSFDVMASISYQINN